MTEHCKVGVSKLWDLVDEALDEAADRSLRGHVAECPACAERLARIERLDAGLEAIAEAGEALELPRIGDYRVLRRLGEGGMGVVYEARQPRPDRPVAIKVMRPVGSWPSRRLRAFRREIQAMGRLSHPSVATVHDAGRLDDGRFYLVMELLRGQPLDRWCEAAAPDLRDRVEIVAGVAEAVQYAHDQGIVHRDLKPSNVLVDEGGTPHVLDFGLAKFLDPEDDVTLSGTVTAFGSPVGTLPYIAPERLRGDASAGTDVQADVYALGVVLYQIVTGRLPYAFGNGVTAAEAQRIVEKDEPPHPSRIVPGVPRALADVILTATAKETGRRYATMEAFAGDLRRFLSGEAVSARAPGLPYRARRFFRRHGLAVTGVLLACGLVLATRGWIDDSAVGPDTDSVTTHLPVTRAPAEYFNYGRQIDFTVDGARAVHLMQNEDRESVLAIWHRATSASTPIDLPTPSLHSPRWSPGNRYIAMVGSDSSEWHLWVLELVSGELTRLYSTDDLDKQPQDLCWSPGGSQITFVTREVALYEVSLSGTVHRWQFTSVARRRWELGGYSPDGRWLVCSVGADMTGKGPADLWSVPRGGGRARQLTGAEEREHSPVFHPDGNGVWFVRDTADGSHIFRLSLAPGTCTANGAPERVTRDGGRGLRDLDFIGGNDLVYRVTREESEILMRRSRSDPARTLVRGNEPVLSPTADTLFYIDRSGDLCALDTDGSAKPVLLAPSIEGAPGSYGGPPPYDLAPDGSRIAYSAATGDAYGVYEVSTATPPRLLVTTTKPVVPRWSAKGARLAYVDDQHLFVLERDRGAVREVAQSVWGWEGWTLQWSPRDDSVLMAVGYATPEEFEGHTNTVFLVDMTTGSARRVTPPGDDYKERVEWHPDGTRLACLAYADSGELVREIRLDGRPAVVLYDEPGHWPFLGAWSPTGEYVFPCFGSQCHGRMHVILPDGSVQHTGHGYYQPPRWSTDGSFAWVRPRIVQHFELLHRAAERGAMR